MTVVQDIREVEVTQISLGSRSWIERVREVLTIRKVDPDGNVTISMKEKIRPKELAKLLPISRQKATVLLRQLDEYERNVLERGCAVYVLRRN